MSQLKLIRSASSLQNIAAILGFKTKSIAFILYVKNSDAKYITFNMTKRKGGLRKISAPSDDLKLLQRRVADLLQNCLEEINKANKWNDKMVHGFMRDRSILTNANRHKNRKCVVNLDLQNFFEAINFGRVRGYFIKNRSFGSHPEVATVLAQIACFQNSIPQGSPCSPVISNLVAHILDIRLSKVAQRSGCTYSRYADDITLSTNKGKLPESIVKPSEKSLHEWEIGPELSKAITGCGYSVNQTKTRVQYQDSRQEVTGLVVNSKVNIRKEYRHTVRAMAHRLFMTGHYSFIQSVAGQDGTLTPITKQGTLAQLHGMLGHIDSVDMHNKKRAQANVQMANGPSNLSTKENLYRRFLIFKLFYVTDSPVIVCEGKTDTIYLQHALRSLAVSYPQLVTPSTNREIKLAIRLFKYTQTSTGRILDLNGGSGDLSKFIVTFSKELKRFRAPGKKHPVIILIDNDGGSKAIYNIIKQETGLKPTGQELFIPVVGNLYVVPTPLLPGNDKSIIEDCFSSQVKQTSLNGKSLSLLSSFNQDNYYGKAIFAQQVVVKHSNSIDFTGFTSILDRIVAVMKYHSLAQVNARDQSLVPE